MKRATAPFLALVMALASFGCDEPEPEQRHYNIHFQASDDRGGPVSALSIAIGETHIGSTDAQGQLRAEVNASRGQRFPLHAACPDHYVDAEVPKQVAFRETKGLSGEANEDLSIVIRCARQDRVVALLIHADGHEDMPVLVNGVPRGKTGAGGFAHLRLDRRPGSQFQISLDSSGHPNLRPKNPSRMMRLGQDDGLFVFDPVFSKVQPKRTRSKRRRSRTATEPTKKRPVRID